MQEGIAMKEKNLDADEVIHMRGLLHCLTYFFKDVLENGIPKKPPARASVDAKCADEEWHECRWALIRDAEEFLRDTEGLLG